MVKEGGEMKKQFLVFLMAISFTLALVAPYAESQEPPKPPIVIAVDGLALREIGPIGIEPYKLTDKTKVIDSPTTMSTPMMVQTIPNKEPDGYLAGALRESAGFKSMNAEIKPYTWSRDPADTKKVVPDLKKNIVQAYEVAKNGNRPLIIVGHSWGSVLAHEALSELSKEGKEVKIDKFITMGSPLTPRPGLTMGLKNIETIKEGLQVFVKKPDNVTAWDNYWARGDSFSNEINRSGVNNIQIDKGQEQSPTLENTKKWHGAYYSNNEWKDNIAGNITSVAIGHGIKTAANQATINVIPKTILPIAKMDAVKMIEMPKTLPMNLPQGNISDASKVKEGTPHQLVTPVAVEFTQTFDGLFTQSANSRGSRDGIHSGTLTDGTRVNVKGDSVAGDFTGSFSGRTVTETGYTPATHTNSAFSGSSVGTASAKGFKEGPLTGDMTVTIPAGTQTATVSGKITIETNGSLSMPSYTGPVTVNATGVKVGTMSGEWNQSKTR